MEEKHELASQQGKLAHDRLALEALVETLENTFHATDEEIASQIARRDDFEQSLAEEVKRASDLDDSKTALWSSLAEIFRMLFPLTTQS